jgi:hypothetical protein
MKHYPFLINNINTYIIFYNKRFIKFNIHTCLSYHNILASYSYIYKLGETRVLHSSPFIQHKYIAKEKEDIVYSPTMVPTQCPVNPRDNRLVEQIQTYQQQVHDNLPQTKQHKFSIKAHNPPRFRFRK